MYKKLTHRSLPYANRLLGLLVGVGLFLYILVPHWDARDFLPVRYVKVWGVFMHVSPSQLQSRMHAFLPDGLFHISIQQMQIDLMQHFPWLSDVTVRRVWPNTLVVVASEHRAVARWNQVHLLSDKGVLFTPSHRVAQATLPLLLGPEDQHKQVWARFNALHALLMPLSLSIASLEYDATEQWVVTLKAGSRLMLGHADTALCIRRLKRFLHFYAQRVAQNKMPYLPESVDLRYLNGFAVKWRKGKWL